MFYLLATILLNVIISAGFKVFPKYKIDTLQAIVTNYCVCVITGSIFIGTNPFAISNIHSGWFPWSVLMGIGFICVFNLIAFCTKVDGITTSVIANKLSLVIPVLFSILVFKEHANFLKISGILLAFPAIYLVTKTKEDNQRSQSLLLPGLLFIGGGLLDTLMNFVQMNFLASPTDQALYTIFCFAVAGTVGVIIVAGLLMFKKTKIELKNIIAGLCIGIPNYFSIYFFIRLLHSPFLQSSASIPVVNIGILVVSALTAVILFREKTNIIRILGLLLAIIAIILIAVGDKTY